MPDSIHSQPLSGASRRRFIQAGAATTAALSFPHVARALDDDKVLKVGLVGCGGRGSGAASQALTADANAHLTAMGDVFSSKLESSHNHLKSARPDQVNVPADARFVGLDAFQKVIDSGVDVVILATPPGFRPQHFKAAVEAGKHIFIEKPMAVDAPGVRSVMESVTESKKKNLNVVAGFCWRYSASRRAAFERVLGGDIGNITAYYATYYTGPVKPMPKSETRPEGMSDVEWQVRNWYNFTWTCGDSLVEQAVHSVDKIAWAMGDQPPLSCMASGGRQLPNNEGNIFDHFNVTYEYPNGVLAFMGSRQIRKCFNENADFILGAKGRCVIGRGSRPFVSGDKAWRFRGEDNNMYQQEHDELFAAIRNGETINNGDRMANSTMLAIMGRMAAYTGQQLTWEQALKSEEDLAPDSLKWDDSFAPHPMPQPGKTKFV